ncbi:MAG TPA: lipoprotein-releasing ABC transporter permease subunit [Steroidobacteraceae bacterium]|nr:lipoprotein-releasing ABC transporter permease subunit [Steroidobacteraceae bacterium]
MRRVFHPFAPFVGLRYVRARTHKFFVSFITWVSLLGVGLGVAALIVIVSVMNGFEAELRDQLLALSAHARIVPVAGAPAPGQAQWDRLAARLRTEAGVSGVAPYVEIQALAVHQPDMLPVVLRGVDPAEEGSVSDIGKVLREGRLQDLAAADDRVLVSDRIAAQLGIATGDPLTLLIPTIAPDGTPAPRMREVRSAGDFDASVQDQDGALLLANIASLRAMGAAAGDLGLRLKYVNALDAPAMSSRLRRLLPADLQIIDWTVDNASYFRAIRIETTMMSLILLLIVAVAAFNIVAMLVMTVTDKRNDIAILRTLGASPRTVMGVFITQGLVIGWVGVALGVALGVVLTLNLGRVEPFLERTLGFHLFDPDVYAITTIPTDLHPGNVAWIAITALVLTLLATLYPALRAAGVPPAEALRYE